MLDLIFINIYYKILKKIKFNKNQNLDTQTNAMFKL